MNRHSSPKNIWLFFVIALTSAVMSCGESASSVSLTIEIDGAGVVSVGDTNCSGTCVLEFEKGERVTLTQSASAGSVFSGWSGACTDLGECTIAVDRDLVVKASFIGSTDFNLTVTNAGNGIVQSNPSGIDCGSDCDAKYPQGTQVVLTATASVGYIFDGWTGACSGAADCNVMMSTDIQVGTSFTSTKTFQVDVSVSGFGEVRSTPEGIVCGTECGGLFPENSEVTLTAFPAEDQIVNWSGICAGNELTCKFMVTEDSSISADFVHKDYDLLLEQYSEADAAFQLPGGSSNNASGITWHPGLNEYLVVINGARRIERYDEQFNYLGRITITDIDSDTEGISYIGDNEVMVVVEGNFAHKLRIDENTGATVDGSTNTSQAYRPLPSASRNSGLEGVGVRPATGDQLARAYVCQEGTADNGTTADRSSMRIVSFELPNPDPLVLLSYETNLTVDEPFNAQALFVNTVRDLAGLVYDVRTGDLIVLSEISSKALQVNRDTGAIKSELTLSGAPQFEGVTIGPNGELVFVSEPNWIRIYRRP